MIRSLRTRHRWTALVLLLALPVGFVAALGARPTWPVADAGGWTVAASELAPLGDLALAARRVEGGLELRPSVDLVAPDLLVYASAEAAPVDSLPADARLLGALNGPARQRFELPPDAATLVLFSLAHQELVGSASLEGVR